MSEFNSAFWFENEVYVEFEDQIYSNKKQIREDFEEFLIANLEELEFKKNKKKSRHSDSICYEYVFEEDTNHKIRVTDDSDGIHIIPLYKNKINEDISEEIVDRDKGETFRQLMDRILDALEVIECTIFDIETKTQTNLTRTPKAIKRGKKIAKLSSKKGGKKYKKKDETAEEFEPEEEKSEDEQQEEDESESFEEFQVSKRRSKRLRKRKKKINRKRKRKRDDSDSESDGDNDDSDSDNDNNNKPKRKRRKLNKVEFRAMKREFVKSWVKKEYVEAVHFVQDEYSMTNKEINDLIEEIYDDGL